MRIKLPMRPLWQATLAAMKRRQLHTGHMDEWITTAGKTWGVDPRSVARWMETKGTIDERVDAAQIPFRTCEDICDHAGLHPLAVWGTAYLEIGLSQCEWCKAFNCDRPHERLKARSMEGQLALFDG